MNNKKRNNKENVKCDFDSNKHYTIKSFLAVYYMHPKTVLSFIKKYNIETFNFKNKGRILGFNKYDADIIMKYKLNNVSKNENIKDYLTLKQASYDYNTYYMKLIYYVRKKYLNIRRLNGYIILVKKSELEVLLKNIKNKFYSNKEY